jgi:hypothetical protein
VSTDASQRTAAATAARRRASQTMLDRVEDALRRMHRDGVPITVRAIARRADVSRTFLYQNPDARQLVTDAASQASRSQDDIRGTSFVASTSSRRSSSRDTVGRRSAISDSSRSIILRPISSMGWRTLVSGGSMWRAMAESS